MGSRLNIGMLSECCIMQATERLKHSATLINQLIGVVEMTDDIVSELEKKILTRKERDKQYRRSKKGLIAKIYSHQICGSKRRKHPMPNYSLDELRAWAFAQPNFGQLFKNWADSGFEKMLVPSCDRLDDYKPYTLDNLQLVTWTENNARGYADRKGGINNKLSKIVLQLTKEDSIIAKHPSARHASRVTGVDHSHLSACCRGERSYAGGFIWRFA